MEAKRQPDFARAKAAAVELLLRQHLRGLFWDAGTFHHTRRVLVDSFQHYAAVTQTPVENYLCAKLRESCTVRVRKISIVLYNEEEKSLRRRNWSIAHELGHIYLEHVSDGAVQEIEAHFFAAELLAPQAVLLRARILAGTLTPKSLTRHFNLSEQAAAHRLRTLENCSEERSPAEERLLLRLELPLQEAFGRTPKNAFPPTLPDWSEAFDKWEDTWLSPDK